MARQILQARRNEPDYNNYIYLPSLPAAIIACITFAIIATVLSIQIRRNRVKYPIILAVGAACESIGYLFRALGAAGRETSFPLYLLMQMFVVLSPLALMAGLYVIYGRLTRRLVKIPGYSTTTLTPDATGEPVHKKRTADFSPLPPQWYARVFVACDISSFLVQAAGAGTITSSDYNTAITGKNILIAGLAFGLVSFVTFVVLMLLMNVNVTKSMQAGEFRAVGLKSNWRMIMLPMLVSSACILIRTVYRLAEFSLGWTGPVNTTEWYLYVFDFIFMTICSGIWIPFFPSKYGLDQSLTGRDEVVTTDTSLAEKGIAVSGVSVSEGKE